MKQSLILLCASIALLAGCRTADYQREGTVVREPSGAERKELPSPAVNARDMNQRPYPGTDPLYDWPDNVDREEWPTTNDR